MDITFTRSNDRLPPALAARADGVTVSIPVVGPLQPMPHDLAHYVVEREMQLDGGFWGSIAAGALFRGMQIVNGRQQPHAAERSKAVIGANGGALGLGEQMVGAIMALIEGHELPQPPLSPHPRTPKSCADYLALIEHLSPAVRQMVDRWQALPVGGRLVVQWPETARRSERKPRAHRRQA